MACHSAIGSEPCSRIRQYGNDSASGALSFCRFHFNVSTGEIDFAPVEALNLRLSQSCESANGEHRKNVLPNAACRFQQTAQFVDAENLRRAVNEFGLCGA